MRGSAEYSPHAAQGGQKPKTIPGLRELHNLWFLKNIRRMSHTIAS